jgi:8-amino-7-oxononanoate synthase
VHLQEALDTRAQAGLLRTRTTVASKVAPQVRVADSMRLQFGSNDYLGLASDPRVIAAATAGAVQWGVGAGASHLVTGHTAAHAQLEAELAAFLNDTPAEGRVVHAALTFSSGYLANLAVLTALCDRESAIFADKLNHACLNDGAVLSRSEFMRFPHNNVKALEVRLATCGAKTKLIAVDGVFSMDGDIAPLDEYLALAERFDAWLLVDDAHAFGVIGEGRGTAAHFNLHSDRIITMGTLGKAAGVAGAFVYAHPTLLEWLINTARQYIYTTAAPPLLAEATRESLRIIRTEPERRRALRTRIAEFRDGCAGLPWALLPSETAIQPLVVGSNAAALKVSAALEAEGLWVPAIRPPTVPAGSARLRVSLSAAHSAPQVCQLIDALHTIAAHEHPH